MAHLDDPRQPPSPSATGARNLDALILRSVGWLGISLGASQIIGIGSMLALARLLDPRAFGLVAVAAAILAVVQQLQESGMASALVYRRNDVERAAGSVLVFAPFSGLLFFGAGFALAPYLADALDQGAATNVIRALLALLLIRSLGVAPLAILERTMSYNARAKMDIASAVTQAAVAVSLAVTGAGVWSLVAGQVAASAVGVGVAWMIVPWRPSPRDADPRILRELLRYGRWAGAARILNVVNRTADNLAVARLVGAAPLGVYAVAFRLADLPVSLLGGIVGRVMFPVYSMLQHDVKEVRRVYVQNLQRIGLVLLPVTTGLMIGARPVVLALLGAKWLPAVTPLRILAAWALVRSLVGPSAALFDGRGKPHLNLVFQAIGTVTLLVLLVALVPPLGVNGAAAAQALAISAVGIPMLLLAIRLIELKVTELARALGPTFLCTAVLAAALLAGITLVGSLTPVVALLVLIATGLVAYLASTAIFARSVVLPMWWSLTGPGNARK